MKYIIDGATLASIATAIRTKSETSGLITPENMPTAIRGLSGVLEGSSPPSGQLGSDGSVYIQSSRDGILTSDGACCINTGIRPNGSYVALCMFRLDLAADNSYDSVFGCRTGSGSSTRFTSRFGKDTTGTLQIQYSRTSDSGYTGYDMPMTKTRCLNAFSLTHAGVKGADTSGTLFTYPIYLFANNDAGSIGDYGNISVKYFVLFDDTGECIQYLVPMLDTNDVPCMHDLITNTNFYNIGTGTFTYTQLDTYTRLLWTKSSGTWKLQLER